MIARVVDGEGRLRLTQSFVWADGSWVADRPGV
jgi:hypothetical protein